MERKIIQEVYLPSGKLIFRTDNKRLMYGENTVKNMIKNGYKVKKINERNRLGGGNKKY